MRRRHFLHTSLAAASAAMLPPLTMATATTPPAPLLARRLKAGMKIGVVAPASTAFDQQVVRFGLEVIESLGFEVEPGKNLFQRRGYLAGADSDRATDLNAMFERPDIDAIFCLRGGYGAMRTLPMLNFEAIRANPKVLLGYSDITVLLNAIYKLTGLVTFHGPMAVESYTDYTYESFHALLLNNTPNLSLGQPPLFESAPGRVERENRLQSIVPGTAQGHLVGGNLTLVAATMGTAYEPFFDEGILVLEDVDESPLRIDRMLTHLKLAGVFDRVRGVALGKFTNAEISGPSLSLETIFNDLLQRYDIPVLSGLMIGHTKDQATLPIGGQAILDADKQTLTTAGPYLR